MLRIPRPHSRLAVSTSVLALLALAGLLPAGAAARAARTGKATPAAEPWEGAPFSATPAALAAAAARVDGEEGDDVVVLLTEASYTYDEAGRETYSQRVVYRVLTAGAQESWSTVEESWEPWHQERT